MSGIQLSEDLLVDIQKTLIKHDESTQDMGVALQYLSAITGLLLANLEPYDDKQRQELLKKLFNFAEHVMIDVFTESSPTPTSANDDSFGIWKPESNNT